jgi:hypothetical protein
MLMYELQSVSDMLFRPLQNKHQVAWLCAHVLRMQIEMKCLFGSVCQNQHRKEIKRLLASLCCSI